jgi:hypothetical protein
MTEMKMSDSLRILLPRPVIAVLLGLAPLAMGQSDAPANLELSERQAASMQSAGASIGGADSTGMYEITVSAITIWTETGLDLRRGDTVLFRAAGEVELPLGQVAGPQGMQSVSVETPPPTGLPLSTAPRAALVARIGGPDAGTLLLVGAQKQINVLRAGRLYLGVNEHEPGEALGTFKVQVEIKRRGANLASRSDEAVAALVPPNVLAKIPQRALNSHGQPEDLVNLLIFGTEEDLKLTFQAAGWVMLKRAEGSPPMSRDALQSLSPEAYLARPLSELYLFGRPQDFSFADSAMAEAVQARHYLRVWRNPSEVNGQTLWVGAAAHDTGPWWNSRTGEVSYKIDPNVDQERDLVRDSLDATGLVNRLGYVRLSAEGQRLKTDAGFKLRTDGRVLVMTIEHLPEL